ncbi:MULTISPECIES: TIGR02680 family protein [unclassified Streptomyces]|uniref:TIGR02680 family protein n=1 Tax=unclassified Streptomyces TaxID=2593676 RepID=UPI000DACFFA5|nr:MULTISPECIES: TIGR02680 family protein [unclassified Streptomyces]PZT72601.1 TIGR02680 family protein [Streptomyces sp. AC1-42T]PZT81081.1 TIGR02680 family protein [Streptomyces sp. AC1-42W]
MSTPAPPQAPAPAPASVPEASAPAARFVPTRAGIINLWDYRDEEFSFAGGWLVLRGPNGSGKTKALEVLFPFVLDGRIDPKRLNPFAAEDRTMKSNLLFRGQDSALGYVWIEFTRQDTGEAVTCGIGLHAQRHRDTPARWHFVTDGRVGEDFSLLTHDDRPMTKKQLAAELGNELIASTADYRAAVDRRLFALGPERYEQLLTLILTLRRPQLAKNLDPGKLSDTLTAGLRPLDEDLIAEAARSFDDMESVQRTLEGLVAADDATRAFLASYSTYLRVHARAAADRLTARRTETAERAAASRTATEELAAARERQAAAEARAESADAALAAQRARLDQLRSSAAYQAVEQLADLERLVRTCEQTARQAGAERERRTAATGRARAEAEHAARLAAELDAAVSRDAAAVADHAHAAGLPWTPADAEPDRVAELSAARAAARHEGVRAVRAAQQTARGAEQTRDLAQAALDRAQEAVGAAETAETEAESALESAREQARTELGRWTGAHGTLLPEAGAARLAEALELTGEAEAVTLADAFTEATAPAVQELRDTLASLRAGHADIERRRAETEAERDRIAAEHDDAPPPARGRGADRAPADGVPLWRLVDFDEALTESQRAGLEAGLEASGLLDALVTAEDGRVPAGRSEGFLRAGAPVDGPSLAGLLRPEIPENPPGEAAVPTAERVTAVLRSVAVTGDPGAGVPHIGPDGRYAAGVLVGAHIKEHAEYVGATARDRRRAARIAACEALLAELSARLDESVRAQARAGAALDAYSAARAALPRTTAITQALRELDRAAARLRATRDAADTARAAYDESVAACSVAERALRRTAAEHGIETGRPEQIDAVETATRAFETAVGELVSRRREHARQADAAQAGADRLTAAAEDEEAAADTERAARRRHTEEAAGLAALQESVGAEAQEVMRQVRETEDGIDALVAEAEAARTAQHGAIAGTAAAEARRTAATEAEGVAAAEEKDTARSLRPYAARELLDILRCPPGLAWPAQEADWAGGALPPAAAGVHEAILSATRDLTPTETSLKQSVTRLTKALEDLQAQLAAAGQDYRPEWDGSDGVILVRVADEEGQLPVAAFAEKISSHRRDQAELLSDSEQRILEDALLTRLAQQIHDRTVDARDLIRRMNTDMRRRQMSSGTTVGVSWLLADHLDDEQRAVCALLDADAARLGPDGLARVRGHFAAQIKTARARHRDQPYRELLAEVLDYRRWRQFAFQLVRPDRTEERLTRARHSRLSGGEQSVSLHLPLFAAAHAMLNSADPHAPRLLALDEAFAGVDDTGRGELMSLAAQFDLDLFMTGYDLWAAHTAVSAAAHYDLAHSAVEHTVSALLLVWDGDRLLADDTGDLTTALGSPGTRRAPAPEEAPVAG